MRTAIAALLLVAAAPTLATAHGPATAAQAARTVAVRDEGHMRFVSAEASTIVDEGAMTGTIPGRGRVWFVYNGSPRVTASFTIHAAGGALYGRATCTLHNPSSPTPSFRGALRIVGGSGRWGPREGQRRTVRRLSPPRLRPGRAGSREAAVLSARHTIALVATGALLVPAGARATQIATIAAGFSPDRLGAHTSVSLGFDVRTPDGSLPSALTGLEFRFPPSLGLGTSGLGLATCDPGRLAYSGPKSCPPNSIMGGGSALAKFQVSPEVSEESASIALVAGPSHDGYVHMLIAATGVYPVAARIVMSTTIFPGRLQFSVPLVPGIPEGPDVAVVRVRVTVGGNLTYYERRHGRRVAYRPQGVLLPRRCPRGGFELGATFSFLDGTQSQAQTTVKCPRR